MILWFYNSLKCIYRCWSWVWRIERQSWEDGTEPIYSNGGSNLYLCFLTYVIFTIPLGSQSWQGYLTLSKGLPRELHFYYTYLTDSFDISSNMVSKWGLGLIEEGQQLIPVCGTFFLSIGFLSNWSRDEYWTNRLLRGWVGRRQLQRSPGIIQLWWVMENLRVRRTREPVGGLRDYVY